jgi:hypothetical protein
MPDREPARVQSSEFVEPASIPPPLTDDLLNKRDRSYRWRTVRYSAAMPTTKPILAPDTLQITVPLNMALDLIKQIASGHGDGKITLEFVGTFQDDERIK